MSVFDDPRGNLQWLEEELLEEEFDEDEFDEEEDYEEPPKRRRWGKPTRRADYGEEESMAQRQAVFVEKKKREKGIRRLKFLAFVELLGILLIIWWWIKWLY